MRFGMVPATFAHGGGKVADELRPKLPKLAGLLDEVWTDVLAYMTFPPQHRTKLLSTNPVERLNGVIKRRTEVAGISPTRTPSFASSARSCSHRTMSRLSMRAHYTKLETIAPLAGERGDPPPATPRPGGEQRAQMNRLLTFQAPKTPLVHQG